MMSQRNPFRVSGHSEKLMTCSWLAKHLNMYNTNTVSTEDIEPMVVIECMHCLLLTNIPTCQLRKCTLQDFGRSVIYYYNNYIDVI